MCFLQKPRHREGDGGIWVLKELMLLTKIQDCMTIYKVTDVPWGILLHSPAYPCPLYKYVNRHPSTLNSRIAVWVDVSEMVLWLLVLGIIVLYLFCLLVPHAREYSRFSNRFCRPQEGNVWFHLFFFKFSHILHLHSFLSLPSPCLSYTSYLASLPDSWSLHILSQKSRPPRDIN